MCLMDSRNNGSLTFFWSSLDCLSALKHMERVKIKNDTATTSQDGLIVWLIAWLVDWLIDLFILYLCGSASEWTLNLQRD